MSAERALQGRSVLVTGHTGFKGAWLTIWLAEIGARVWGLSLAPETRTLFEDAGVASLCTDLRGDVRDRVVVDDALARSGAEVVFHLAAQALVGRAQADPMRTYTTNVVGTANVLEAVRARGAPCAVVIVTSDKCYRPPAPAGGYREEDPLGGDEPYGASKAAAEHVVAGYRGTYFHPDRMHRHGVAVSTARAGNVVGGGDWAEDRVIPDTMRALETGRPVPLRNPDHVRPWQHVLAPLGGYLELAARTLPSVHAHERARYASAWNFGPPAEGERTVRDVVELVLAAWGSGSWTRSPREEPLYEAPMLRLDSSRAHAELDWRTPWDLAESCYRAVDWYRARMRGGSPEELRRLCTDQIAAYAA